MFKLNKVLGLILVILMLLIVIPSCFANENDTVIAIDDVDDNPIASIEGNILQGNTDWYFDISVENDTGDGSKDNPYKYLTAGRIKSNANIYLADGVYSLDASKTVTQVNFIGTGANTTTIRYDGVAFTTSSYLSLSNLTIDGATIQNTAKLDATNVVFSYGHGTKPDNYGNNYGGAIYCSGNTQVNINNCTFNDNYAVYGGAIYMKGGVLEIADCLFIDNMAYNYGGSIACEGSAKVSVSKSKFFNSYSMDDAGGAIYLKSSSLTINDVEVVNSLATFGGAIASLNSEVTLSYLKVSNSSAKWDGGAIYHMYGAFSSTYGSFFNNSAENGGALFIDNSTKLFLKSNTFKGNNASLCAGAIYSLCNSLESSNSVRQFNTFEDNVAAFRNDEYEQSSVNVNIAAGNYSMYKYNETVFDGLPSYFSLRHYNFTTSTKDQQSGGNCWAFATLAALESAILKASGQYLDLSEENMKNVIAKYSDYGWKMETNDGGYDNMPVGYLVSWLGPVLESDDAYDDKSTLSPVLDSIMHVQNIAFLKRDDYLDNDDIKGAILKYGAVVTPILYDNKYFRGNGYYCWSNDYANHLVAIVGWNDSYSRSNFYGLSSDKGDGAWIVKNSWGSGWGDGGYFYVSYYDEVFAQVKRGELVFAFILNDTIRYDKNYQYDLAGMTDYFYTGDDELWYKNVFYAEGDEFIAGASTYFEKITNWTVNVYVNGNLQVTCQGTSNPGYYTIDLGRLIPVHAGDEFEVEFKVSNSGAASIPISEEISLNKELYKPGISFISSDGQNWVDFYNRTGKYLTHTYYSQVACIKAFTIENVINTTLGLSIGDDLNVTANVFDQYGNILKNGNVTFNVNGVDYTLNIADGCAVLANYVLNQTHNVITATFNQIGYNSSANATAVDIPKTNVSLSLAISRFLNDVEMYLESPNNINTTLMVNINNKNYPVIISNGKGYLNFTGLENNVYAVDIGCGELSAYQFDNISESFVVDVKATRIISADFVTFESSGALFNVTLVDENGAVLIGKQLTIVLNNSTIINNTDSHGIVSVPINLTYGEYSVDIDFNGDRDYYKSNQTSNIKVKMNVAIDMNVQRFVNNVVVNVNLSKPLNESLTLTVRGKPYKLNLTAGMASLELFDLSNGVYNVEASLDDVDNYNCQPTNSTFTIDVKNTQIVSSDLTINDEDDASFNVILRDENGIALANRNVTFLLNEVSYSNITDDAGIASILLDLDSGDYEISMAFDGDNDHFNTTASNSIKVKTKVAISVFADVYQNGAVINVNISKPINDVVYITLNGDGHVVNAADGVASLELSDLSNGRYDMSVGLDDDLYEFSQLLSTFTVDVEKTKIVSGDLITSEASGDLFNISLVDGNGHALTNEELIIVLNNSTLRKTTDSYGMVSVPINLTYGQYSVGIDFSGDKNHFASTQSNNIKVKMNVDLAIGVERSVNNAVINVNLSKAINESLTVIVNGKSYSVNSVNGKAALELFNLSNADYDVSVSLDDADNYNSHEAISKFTIDVKRTEIISADLLVSDDDDINFNVKLTDENGMLLANRTIAFVLDNVRYDRVTDVNGVAFVDVNLANGKYVVVAAFAGDNDYFASNASNVIKVKTDVDIDVSINLNQNNAVVNIGMSKAIDESLTVLVNDKQYAVNLTNGNGVLKLSGLSNGVYNVIVGLDEDKYNSQAANSNFTVDVKSTQIISSNLIACDDDDVSFNITLADENGALLSNKNVTFVLNGISYNKITDAYGVASVSVDLAMGEYDVAVGFAGDNHYFASSASNVIKIKANVGIDVSASVSHSNAIIYINVSKLANGTLTVTVNEKPYSITSKNGRASLELFGLPNGKYDVAVSLDDVDNYNSRAAGCDFTVEVVENNTAPSEVVVVDDEKNQFNLTITDEKNNVLVNKQVSVVLDDVRYDLVSDDKGQVSIPLDLSLGQHSIDVYVKDDNDQLKSVKSDTIAIKSKVDMDYEIDSSSDKTVINVNISKKVNGTLQITVDNESYMLPINDTVMSLILPDLDADMHDVEIRIVEDNFYEFDELSAKVKVSPKKTVIMAGDMATYYKSGQAYAVTLIDEYGNPLSGCDVHFKFSNNVFVAKTDESGRASINVSLINGDYQISVRFDGNSNYLNSSNSAKINVKSTIVITDSLIKTYNSSYSFKLLDANGNPLKNARVVFSLDNVDYAGMSDKNGIVTVEIVKQPGSHKLVIYNPLNNESLSRTITVLERIVNNNNITIYEYSGSTYKVRVLDDDGNPEASGKNVTFKIAGKTCYALTDENGYASLKISLKAKQYTVTASYKGFKVSNKVKVKPVLTSKNVSKKKAKAYKFQAKLVNKNGKALKGKKITFKIKGKKYTSKTNKNGVATITIKLALKVGTYKIYTSYGKSKITNTLKIRK